MRRLCLLVCLIVAPGCMSDPANGNGPLAEAFKDARGDNMRMRSDMSRLDSSSDTMLRPRARE